MAGVHQLLSAPREPRTRGDRLEASSLAAQAPRTVEPDDHVPQFAGRAAHTVIDLAVNDDPATHAGADRQVHQEARASSGAEAVLAERRRVGVVLEQRRDAQPLAHDLDKRNAVPPRELRRLPRLEHELTKTRIFELYLNEIEWGDGIYGAEAAARTYFGTSASSLNPDQAALMVSF